MRSSDVGAIIEMSLTPCLVQYSWRSSFSSYGRSGTMTAQIPASSHLCRNLSLPYTNTGLK